MLRRIFWTARYERSLPGASKPWPDHRTTAAITVEESSIYLVLTAHAITAYEKECRAFRGQHTKPQRPDHRALRQPNARIPA
jgi:hypothetical protein